MPLLAYVLLLIAVLLMLGIACACVSDHPVKIDRAGAAVTTAPAVIEVWSFAIILVLVSFALGRPRVLAGRSSAATLQRFLF